MDGDAPVRQRGFRRRVGGLARTARSIADSARRAQDHVGGTVESTTDATMAWIEAHSQLRVLYLTADRFGTQQLPTFAAAISFQTFISLFPLIGFITAIAAFLVEPEVLGAIRHGPIRRAGPGGGGIPGKHAAVHGRRPRERRRHLARHAPVDRQQSVWRAATRARRGDRRDPAANLCSGPSVGSRYDDGHRRVARRFRDRHGRADVLAAIGVARGRIAVCLVGVVAALAWRAPPVLFATGVFGLMYHLVPAERLAWRPALAGGLVGAVGFEIGRTPSSGTRPTSGSFNAIYGPIATIVLLLIWIYFSSMIFLAGAAFGSAVSAAMEPASPPNPAVQIRALPRRYVRYSCTHVSRARRPVDRRRERGVVG